MTTTDLLSSQSIGTSTNIGDKKFPSKTTANVASTAYSLNVKITFGNGMPIPANTRLRVWYTSSSFSLSAAEAAVQLDQATRYVDVLANSNPAVQALVAGRNSFIEPLQGAYIYTWCEVPELPAAATLDIKLVEI